MHELIPRVTAQDVPCEADRIVGMRHSESRFAGIYATASAQSGSERMARSAGACLPTSRGPLVRARYRPSGEKVRRGAQPPGRFAVVRSAGAQHAPKPLEGAVSAM